jgi:hypothetical protein
MKTSELQRLMHTADRRGRVARVAVGVMTALHAVRFVLARIQLEAMARSGPAAIADAAANKERIGVVLLLVFVGTFVSGGLYLFWLVAAVTAARDGGREIGGVPKPRDAVVAYIVPIISLYRPLRHMQRLLEASDPGDLPPVTEVRTRETAGYRDTATERVARPYRTPWVPVRLWWWVWVAGSILSAALVPGSFSAHGDPIAGAESTALTDGLHVAAGILCILVIAGVAAMQRERLRRIVAVRHASAGAPGADSSNEAGG